MSRGFSADLNYQYPFFHSLAWELKGVEVRNKMMNGARCYRVECPACKREKALFYLSQNRDTFIVGCPCSDCSYSASLHSVINSYGSERLKKRWLETINQNQWLPIKNRRKPGPKKKKAFKEEMAIKSDLVIPLSQYMRCKDEDSWKVTKKERDEELLKSRMIESLKRKYGAKDMRELLNLLNQKEENDVTPPSDAT